MRRYSHKPMWHYKNLFSPLSTLLYIFKTQSSHIFINHLKICSLFKPTNLTIHTDSSLITFKTVFKKDIIQDQSGFISFCRNKYLNIEAAPLCSVGNKLGFCAISSRKSVAASRKSSQASKFCGNFETQCRMTLMTRTVAAELITSLLRQLCNVPPGMINNSGRINWGMFKNERKNACLVAWCTRNISYRHTPPFFNVEMLKFPMPRSK